MTAINTIPAGGQFDMTKSTLLAQRICDVLKHDDRIEISPGGIDIILKARDSILSKDDATLRTTTPTKHDPALGHKRPMTDEELDA